MTPQQRKDAAKSAKYFGMVAEAIGGRFCGDVVPVEGHHNDFERSLDRDYSIDGLLMRDNEIIPYAQRTQFNKPYRAFSVRKSRTNGKETEWDKLSRAFENRAIRPKITFSIYVDEKHKIAQVARIDTDVLIRLIADGYADVKSFENGEFYTISWQALSDLGYFVEEFQVNLDD